MRRQYTSFNRRSEFGRSHVDITCPFCGTDCTAYVWSLAGGGKKCPTCGSLHTGMGYTIAPAPEVIEWNYNDFVAQKKAVRRKRFLENKGYILIDNNTNVITGDSRLIYTKKIFCDHTQKN